METLQNFLSSDAFEKMAKEYQTKYAYATIIQNKKDERLLEKVENAFSQIFRLFYLFEFAINNIRLDNEIKHNSMPKFLARVLFNFRLFKNEEIKVQDEKEQLIGIVQQKINTIKNRCKNLLGKDILFKKEIDKNKIFHKQCLFCLLDIEKREVDLIEEMLKSNYELANGIHNNIRQEVIDIKYINSIKEIFLAVYETVEMFYEII